MDYWKECIEAAFNDAGIEATPEQIEAVAGDVECGHENYGMAFGHDAIPNPMHLEVRNLEQHHAREIRELEGQISVFRRSVARRRGIRECDVYIEGDSVMYRPA